METFRRFAQNPQKQTEIWYAWKHSRQHYFLTAPNQKHSGVSLKLKMNKQNASMYPSTWWDSTQAETQILIKASMPSERIWTQATRCMIPICEISRKGKLKTESRSGAGWGLGQRPDHKWVWFKTFCVSVFKAVRWWLHDYVNLLKITMYTCNGWILWHANYTTIQRHEN